MGTRADFYAGKGKDAEWLGSIAWDGMDISGHIRAAKTEDIYRKAVEVFLASRDDATLPKNGWPWPWNDSGTSDCSYWFFEGKCWEAEGKRYVPARGKRPDVDDEEKYDAWVEAHERIEYPDMSSRKNVDFGKRSGLIIIGA